MTGASVKDLGSIMTFVNSATSSRSKGFESDFSFGDMMSKAQSNPNMTELGTFKTDSAGTKGSDNANNTFKRNDNVTETSKPQETVKSSLNDRSELKTEKAESSEEALNTENSTQTVPEDAIPEETMEVLASAAMEIVEDIAQTLDIPIRDVEEAMEELGMTSVSLLDSDNLENLILTLNDEKDPIALVTDENLFNAVKNLTSEVDATLEDLASDMDMAISDLKDLLAQAEEQQNSQTEINMSVESNSDLKSVGKILKETVEEDEGEKNSSMEIKTSSNTETTESFTNKVSVDEKNQDSNSEEHSEANEHGKSADSKHDLFSNEFAVRGFKQENPVFDNLVNSTNEAITEAPTSYANEQTQRIMSQILEHMRVNIKPDVNELEMQLHPASLGNVKVTLTARAGEVTAEFKVQNEQVKAAMESQLADLRETFKAQGTKVTQIEVSVELQSYDSNLWNGKQDEQRTGKEATPKKTRRIRLDGIDSDSETDEELTQEDKLTKDVMIMNGQTVDFTA